jgi:hypothetical protein
MKNDQFKVHIGNLSFKSDKEKFMKEFDEGRRTSNDPIEFTF